MRRMFKTFLILLTLGASLAPRFADARVVRFVVEQKRPLAEGTSFGSVGGYERLDGTAYFEVDPKDPLNAVIVNLDKAPRNARGMVEFSSPFVILKPVEMAKGNHKIFYAINNRGNQQAISYFNFGPGGNYPLTVANVGDGFLMRLGYTIVDAAWEGDPWRYVSSCGEWRGASRLRSGLQLARWQPDDSASEDRRALHDLRAEGGPGWS
jgi:hypothetical protein